ncbi:MAG TPA: NAD(P)/FAD-dependent oxidoreductase [Porticoccaceae bacterium]|nr:NAD(P)/FAD-dependent oxidoreductase [Porticoccaceae bacterium]HIL18930.1 NAD(P)/FAD-dependent oxidoreductase [Gammaproteobacteria bacterium]
MKKPAFARNITRRDFLNGTSIGMGGMLLGLGAPNSRSSTSTQAPRPSLGPDWYGYGGVGDYRSSHGNTPEVVANAHRLRDQGYPRFDQLESVEEYDYVIVGSGIAGLSAGLEFTKKRKDGQTCLMLDNHPIFGGEAKENEFNVGGTRMIAPQGANGFFIPEAVDDPATASGDARYYAELGLPREYQLGDWPETQKPLKFCADNFGYLVRGLQENTSVGHFFNGEQPEGGTWAIDMWEKQLKNTPLSKAERETLLGWYHTGATRKYASEAEAIADLDTMSYKEFLEKELGFGPEAAAYGDMFLASANGLGSDAHSAYAAYKLPMPGFMDMPPPELRRSSFPGGNSGFARHFLKKLIPAGIEGKDRFEDIITGRINFQALDRPDNPLRMRLSATVLSVEHDGPPDSSDGVTLVYIRDGKFYGVRAKAVVMATGSWINRHVVKDLPDDIDDACSTFQYAPFLVANVALNNWRFLHDLGISAAIWDRVDGDFGYTCNIRNSMQVGDYQPPLDPDKPIVLSFYKPFYYPGLDIAEQGTKGRIELLSTSYSDYERQIYAQMMKLFGSSGFNAQRDVAGVILNRWGHAYSVPYPGFYGGKGGIAPRDVIRKGYGRIAFGHSELDGLQHYGPAADEGRRAMTQALLKTV